MTDDLLDEAAGALEAACFARLPGRFATVDAAWRTAADIVATAASTDSPLEVIGDFVIPSPDGPESRNFQTLHFDFGVPLVPTLPGDVACFTALHVAEDEPAGPAITRLVPLRPLLSTRQWPDHEELLWRFAAYGVTHGAWDDAAGYVEGSLARVVEAATGQPPALPNVKTTPGFLCGTEFATLADEQQFFADRQLELDTIGLEIRLRPGQLLIFDNLAVAHGRRGRRRPGELHQRVFGYRAATVDHQRHLRDLVLAAFA